MTKPRYPRRAVPTRANNILCWEQDAPDAPVVLRCRDGKAGPSLWNSIGKVLVHEAAVEVFDHLPAEEVSYGAREPDGTRTVIVEDAGQKRYPRRAVNVASPVWTAEQKTKGAEWSVFFNGSPEVAHRITSKAGDNMIRDGIWRETFGHLIPFIDGSGVFHVAEPKTLEGASLADALKEARAALEHTARRVLPSMSGTPEDEAREWGDKVLAALAKLDAIGGA